MEENNSKKERAWKAWPSYDPEALLESISQSRALRGHKRKIKGSLFLVFMARSEG